MNAFPAKTLTMEFLKNAVAVLVLVLVFVGLHFHKKSIPVLL